MVGPRTNWLPPDNFQEYLQAKLAERISPTNEGLYLTSGLVARDFGFIGLHGLVEGWEKNLATWSNLEKFHGHFYNWYETSTLLPLRPRYISTVDSGNSGRLLPWSSRPGPRTFSRLGLQPRPVGRPPGHRVPGGGQHPAPRRRSLGKVARPAFDRMANAFEEFQGTFQTCPVPAFVEWNTVKDGRRTGRPQRRQPGALSDESFPADDLRTAVDILIQHLDGLEEDRLTLLAWADAPRPPLLLHDGPEVEAAADAVTRRWLRLRKELSQANSPRRLAAIAGASAPPRLELESFTSAQLPRPGPPTPSSRR